MEPWLTARGLQSAGSSHGNGAVVVSALVRVENRGERPGAAVGSFAACTLLLTNGGRGVHDTLTWVGYARLVW